MQVVDLKVMHTHLFTKNDSFIINYYYFLIINGIAFTFISLPVNINLCPD